MAGKPKQANIPHGYYDLIEQLERAGCAICALILHAGKQYMESLLYEFSLDEGVQQAFRSGRGLCNHHSWLLVHQHGYSLGVSVLFEAALDEVVEIMESTAPSAPSITRLLGRSLGGGLEDRLEPQGPCLVCANVQEAEARYVQTFAEHWSMEALQTAFRASDGLCLPHLREVLRQMEARMKRKQLIDFHVAKWTALKAELDQFQLKSAYNYVGDPMGAEANSWKRAVASLTGSEYGVPALTRTKPD
jgi:hypothetical protein